MLSPENEVFSGLALVLRETFKGITVLSHEVRTYAKFPCVVIVESSNITRKGRFDYTHKENYVNLTYTIEIYSDKNEGYGKMECVKIAQVIDDWMMEHGFTRTMNQPAANYQSTISRRRLKYNCTYDSSGLVYRQVGTT